MISRKERVALRDKTIMLLSAPALTTLEYFQKTRGFQVGEVLISQTNLLPNQVPFF